MFKLKRIIREVIKQTTIILGIIAIVLIIIGLGGGSFFVLTALTSESIL